MKHKLLHLQSLVAVALCVIMAMAFNSCSDDDDDDEPASNRIVGTWRLSLKDDDGGFWYCQYHFKSDGTFEGKDWSSKDPYTCEFKGTYTVSNPFISIKFDNDDYDDVATYRFSIEGNKLIIYDYEEDGPNVFYKV